ncbi:MAG: ArsR family transcriptional regulator [Dehalococcoidia bacterium]
MESTKDHVLRLLRARSGATVAGLAEELGVGQASVRRHLDHLRVDGLADVRVERHGVGRPAFVFYPTEEAEERAPAGYSRLLSRLYQGLRSLDAGQVGGRDGAHLLHTAFEAAAEQVAEEHKSEVEALSLEGRVAETSQTLQREGIVDGWEKQADGFHLSNSACPYRQAALASTGPCELDRRTIELLVAAPVRQVSRIADGRPACEYIVAEGGARTTRQAVAGGDSLAREA